MTENKRYIVKGSDDFFLHIEDTTFTEDKHEGFIYNIYQVVDRLNEQEELIYALKNENKQLKAQLEKGGDVCSICKYEYLVASTEYYIAQCKKGHDECSKGDVDYCEDFELKGDVE